MKGRGEKLHHNLHHTKEANKISGYSSVGNVVMTESLELLYVTE
jgi:hypothetical protein